MTNDIKGLGLPPSTDKAIRSTAKDGGSVAQAPAQPAPAPTGAGKAAAESVSLSSNAQALKAVEARIQKLPEINEKKVAEIKAALDSGQYSVDDLVIGSPGADPAGKNDAGTTYVVFGRDGTNGALPPGDFELSALAAGDGSTGFVVNGIQANDQAGDIVAAPEQAA